MEKEKSSYFFRKRPFRADRLEKGNLVWAAYKDSYWPALVRSVDKKKRKVRVWYADITEKCYKVPFKKIKDFEDVEFTKEVFKKAKLNPIGHKRNAVFRRSLLFFLRRINGIKEKPADFLDTSKVYGSSKLEFFYEDLSYASSDGESLVDSDEENHPITKYFPGICDDKSPYSDELVDKTSYCVKAGYLDEHLMDVADSEILNERHDLFVEAESSGNIELLTSLPPYVPVNMSELMPILNHLSDLYEQQMGKDKIRMYEYVSAVWLPETFDKVISLINRNLIEIPTNYRQITAKAISSIKTKSMKMPVYEDKASILNSKAEEKEKINELCSGKVPSSELVADATKPTIDRERFGVNLGESSKHESLVDSNKENHHITESLPELCVENKPYSDELVDKILSCIKAGHVDEYLMDVVNSKIVNKRHDLFFKAVETSNTEQLSSFPSYIPIHNTSKLVSISLYLSALYEKQIGKDKPRLSQYVASVWLPEAVDKAISLIKTDSMETPIDEGNESFLYLEAEVKETINESIRGKVSCSEGVADASKSTIHYENFNFNLFESSGGDSLVGSDEEDQPIAKSLLEVCFPIDSYSDEMIDKILSFIKAGHVDDHLMDVLNSKIASERHSFFIEAVETSNIVQFPFSAPFIPVANDEELVSTLNYLSDLYERQNEKDKPAMFGYIISVWLPEAVDKAMSLIETDTLESPIFAGDTSIFYLKAGVREKLMESIRHKASCPEASKSTIDYGTEPYNHETKEAYIERLGKTYTPLNICRSKVPPGIANKIYNNKFITIDLEESEDSDSIVEINYIVHGSPPIHSADENQNTCNEQCKNQLKFSSSPENCSDQMCNELKEENNLTTEESSEIEEILEVTTMKDV